MKRHVEEEDNDILLIHKHLMNQYAETFEKLTDKKYSHFKNDSGDDHANQY